MGEVTELSEAYQGLGWIGWQQFGCGLVKPTNMNAATVG
jgi:hypothetical protein